jgi:Host cell surface-exposed lipoprotein
MSDQQFPPGNQPPAEPYQQYASRWQDQQPPRKRRHTVRNVLLSILGVIVLIIVIAAATSGGKNNPPAASSATNAPAAAAPATSSAPAPPVSSAPAAPQYTVSQQSAITAAEQYLSMGEGFSREGLIQQLDSSAGSGFSVADAKFAVNHITVNWDQQAALAAKGYMQTEGGFSYSSMVQQLESSAGSGFTHAQAVFGAKSVGL